MKGVRCVNCVMRVGVLRDLNTFMLLFLYFCVYSSVLLPGMMKGEPETGGPHPGVDIFPDLSPRAKPYVG